MNAFSEDSFRRFGGSRKLQVDEDGITVRADNWSTQFNWSAIVNVQTDDKYAFVHSSRFQAIVVPRASVPPKDFDNFVELAKRKQGDQNA